jgi:outer membrane murein-binding lipoprotein Lpp
MSQQLGYRLFALACVGLLLLAGSAPAQKLAPLDVEGQPLAANVTRLLQALDFLGAPLSSETTAALKVAAQARGAKKIQELLDPNVLVVVTLNPESRVKAARGPATATLRQHGYTPVLLKIVNDSTVMKALHITSPQSGPVYSGGGGGKPDKNATKDRFLQVDLFASPPMTANLSGLKVEYAIALVYSAESGKREATLAFDVGQGTQDLGFRGETPVLFDIKPAIPVKLSVTDFDGKPTTGRFTFKDKAGHVFPAKAKRLAPDFFFQDQVYRHDGGTVLLPPGELVMTYSRGPEYRQVQKKVTIPSEGNAEIAVKLERWINPLDYGWYSGDHHIHAAGCAHYENPTEGVFAQDMFLHVKGEALNVGCNLTWGPCYDFQRQFFEPDINKVSEPFTVLKYDVEVSGFGSQAMGHVCLLNLKDQTYPGSDGTKTKGWPTWTTPVMRWVKEQGGVTGYAHSASGLMIPNPTVRAQQMIAAYDTDKDGKLNAQEAAKSMLPEDFARIDTDNDGQISVQELAASVGRQRDRLPNLVVPPMDGIGAQEICVSTAMGVCDFISAMDTARVPEWNCWYHIMNCGFPLKASGETDFPCISGSRVGQGRVYVQLGKVDRVDFKDWCNGIAQGRSYVSDGYAHAAEFTINGKAPGFGDVNLDQPGHVTAKAKVAFASQTPLGTSSGGMVPAGNMRKVELVVNGVAVASKQVPADDQVHEVSFDVNVDKSSWVALRHFPQMHTNPVNVLVAGKPIRASRQSAQWCLAVIDQLWRVRGPGIAASERDEAHKTFEKAKDIYRKIAAECPEGT